MKFTGGRAGLSPRDKDWHGGNPFEQRHLRGGNTALPLTTWYDFQTKAWSPVKTSFTVYQEISKKVFLTMPADFALIGSNDSPCSGASDWLTLCEKSYGRIPSSLNDTRSCDPKQIVAKKFRCLGLKIVRTHSDERRGLKFSNLRIFAKL